MCGEADARHAEADTGARLLACCVRVTRTGAPMGVRGAVGDEVVRRRTGDDRGDDVAGPDIEARRVEMHQSAISGAARHACGAGVLTAFACGDQQLDGAPDLRGVLLQRYCLLHVDQPLIAFLHNDFRQLTL